MKLKRHPIFNDNGDKIGIEPWLEWQIRALHRAGCAIHKLDIGMSKLVDNERLAWAGRISRFGLAGSSPHLVKYLVAWRSRFWWETQKWYNNLGWNVLKHTFPFKPRRWEDSLPLGWLNQFCNQGPMGTIL